MPHPARAFSLGGAKHQTLTFDRLADLPCGTAIVHGTSSMHEECAVSLLLVRG